MVASTISQYNRGLVVGSVSVMLLWILNDLTDLGWWLGIPAAAAVGFLVALVARAAFTALDQRKGRTA